MTGSGAAQRPDSSASSYDELIANASTAQGAGSLLEAIEWLTAANRLDPRGPVEHRLMQLRRDAAVAGDPVHRGPDVWPPVLANPFPGTSGLPEIAGEALDGAMLGGAIVNHGALLVRGLASEGVAVALRDAIDLALGSRDDAGRDVGSYAPLDVPGDEDLAVGRAMTELLGGGLLSVDSPRAFFLFAELVAAIGFTGAVRDYLGQHPVLSANKTTFRRLREAPDTAWHQDGSFMGPVRAVNLWIALSHCGGSTDIRGLDVIPCRMDRLLETGTEGAGAEVAAIAASLVDRSVPTPMITPEFHPGDALCFDDRFLHRTSAAEVSGQRHAVEAWFFAPSHFPEGYTAVVI